MTPFPSGRALVEYAETRCPAAHPVSALKHHQTDLERVTAERDQVIGAAYVALVDGDLVRVFDVLDSAVERYGLLPREVATNG